MIPVPAEMEPDLVNLISSLAIRPSDAGVAVRGNQGVKVSEPWRAMYLR